MKQYEDFAAGDVRWLPYLVFFNRTGYRSPVVNTDAGGFRLGLGPDGPCSLLENRPDGEVNVLLGGSPAFGFGATADEHTITSALSRGERVPWLNLGAPAFNSTQELVLFMLHRHQLPRVRDIIVFSGLNDLVVAGLPDARADYGQFFFSGEFFSQLGVPEAGQQLRQPKWALGRLAQRIGLSSGAAEPEEPRTPTPEERVDTAVAQCARDLDRLLELAAPTGARVHFVLQPTALWTGKRRSPEERALIDDADRKMAAVWDLFRPILDPAVHAAYRDRLAEVCAQRSVSFFDANPAVSGDEWFFVDLVHLNDEGNRVVAEALRTGLGLGGDRELEGVG
ncbi:SGNH/GDSL hydrolase family protein [Saccharothrix syringae]|uniref:SGNH/GDSL hydrolase family protein n=2 Tax=Saccharothrix syringae TaxID=103733 RepID=A0A5Q0HF85_SACSY|nr:SGNH/GDSL hydrolase family protein [Saccharothrix syringae]